MLLIFGHALMRIIAVCWCSWWERLHLHGGTVLQSVTLCLLIYCMDMGLTRLMEDTFVKLQSVAR
jgi:hypothetical protein